jgi:exodeoxyribonuclease VII large subunit
MPRPAKSQWDFGELFPPEQTRKVLTVTELTLQVRRLLEKQVGQIWVTGEISNLRAQSSGHVYFTLKDANAQLACVLFRGEASVRRDLLQDGQKVLLCGDLTVYEARGQYQLIVRAVEPQGLGALQLAFERLKQKLNAAGLFASERKRPLPRYIQRIGLVTSPTGAAIRDVITVVRRRYSGLEIVLVPCKVQGEGAALEIAAAIRNLNSFNATLPADQRLDVILATRGGGSLEDLWAFNEEIVARAIYESALPVVSAVGHEIDYTISDFVADVRAPTPSAAAEILTEGMYASRQLVAEAVGKMQQQARRRREQAHEDLQALHQRLGRCHPRRRLNEQLQWLDDLQEALLRNAKRQGREQASHWQNLALRLARLRPSQRLALRRETFQQLHRRLQQRVQQGFDAQKVRLDRLTIQLRLLAPEQTLARGYSITSDAITSRIIRNAQDTKKGQRLRTRVHQGEILSVVDENPAAAK